MGIRSDVAIAMKECVVNHLSPEARTLLEEYGFEERARVEAHGGDSEDEAGSLFVTEGVKWYHDYPDIQAFYTHLEDCHDEEDFLIVTACGEYPESDEGNAGEWHDNPFNIHKQTTVELSWEA
jgi:hypothetical protein